MVLAGRALVVLAEGWIGADDQKILAGGKALMTGPGRENGDVTCFQLKDAPAASTKLNLAFAAGDSENFMDARMVVNVVINPVTPGIVPAVALEQLFEHGCRIDIVGN